MAKESRLLALAAAMLGVTGAVAGCGTASGGDPGSKATHVAIVERHLTASELRKALLTDRNLSPFLRRDRWQSDEDSWSYVDWRCLGALNFFADEGATARTSDVYMAPGARILSEVIVTYADSDAADNALEEARSAVAGCPRDEGEVTRGTEDTYEATAEVVRRDLAPADDELDVRMSLAQRDWGTLKILRRFHEDVVVFRAANHVVELAAEVDPASLRRELLAAVVPLALHRLAAVAQGQEPDDGAVRLSGWRRPHTSGRR